MSNEEQESITEEPTVDNAADAIEVADAQVAKKEAKRNPTVVVAEDESVNRMDLVAMLEDNGYEVVGEAANGEEAIELTREKRPDVVCMDVKMPHMDGITAAGVICDENLAPVVMLTAFSQADLVKEAIGAGAMAYVTKPMRNPSCCLPWRWPWAVSPRSTICLTAWNATKANCAPPRSS